MPSPACRLTVPALGVAEVHDATFWFFHVFRQPNPARQAGRTRITQHDFEGRRLPSADESSQPI